MSLNFVRREIPIILTFIVGMLITISFFITSSGLSSAVSYLKTWGVILSGIALIYSFFVFIVHHVIEVQRKKAESWYLSLWTLTIAIIYVIVGLLFTVSSPIYTTLFNNINTPISVTFSVATGFLVISLFYRAFTVRKVESALLVIGAIFTMFINMPLIVNTAPQLAIIGNWILNYPNSGAQRGILMAAAVGVVAMSLRTLIGKERKHEV